MRYLIGFCLAILLSSCVTTTTNFYPDGSFNRRMGRPYQTIYGPATTTYIYKTITYRSPPESLAPEIGVANPTSPHPAIVTPNPPGSRSISLVCYTTIVMNKQGRIISTSKEGAGC